MDDQHRQPRDGDRRPVRDRIQRAVRDGRISPADAEIRLTNVTSAQSMGELGLIVRDLDQLEAVVQGGEPVTAPAPLPGTGPVAVAASVATGVRRTVPLLVLGLALAIVAAGVVGLVVFSSGGGSGSASGSSEVDLPDALPVDPGAPVDGCPTWPRCGEEPAEEPTGTGGTTTPYRLDADGIRAFLADYRAEFSTTRVVDLSMYDEYVIVRVPVPGRQRSTGWRYADGTFTEFGPATANFPGSATVDTAKLDLAKLVRNIATARRTLNVEDYSSTYVRIDYRPDFDEAVNVNIYVSNAYSESGYLATTLTGRIERAYPYGG